MAIYTNEQMAYFLVPVNATGIPGLKSKARPINGLGPDGTTDDGVPGTVLYTPFTDQYGIFSIKDIEVIDNINIMGTSEIFAALLYIDERAPGEGVEMPAVDASAADLDFAGGDEIVAGDYVIWLDTGDAGSASSDPENPTPPVYTQFAQFCNEDDVFIYVNNPAGFPDTPFDIYFSDNTDEGMTVTDGFGTNIWGVTRAIQGAKSVHYAGTAIFWYPPPATAGSNLRKYEMNSVIEDPPESGILKLRRHYPPDPRNNTAYFESLRTAHAAQTKVYRLKVRHFSLKVRQGGAETSTNPSGLPNRMDMLIPAACVAASLVSIQNYYGYGPFTTYNCTSRTGGEPYELPPTPGIRTLTGQAYMIPVAGVLEVGENSATPLRIQDWASIRCIYAEVSEAPEGGDITIDFKIADPGTTDPDWTVIETITIEAGKRMSFDPESTNTPSNRRMPYDIAWPPQRLAEDCLITIDITAVGASSPGKDLLVYLQT